MTRTHCAWLLGTVIVLTAGCAARETAPTVDPIPRPLILSETLPRDAQVCVVRDAWHDPSLVCISVSALRTWIRGGRPVSLEVTR